MKIEEYVQECTSEHTLFSAVIGGRELWYRFPPSFRVERPGDVLVAAALFPAMLTEEPLEVDRGLPVSPQLIEGLETIQKVFSSWYPMLHRIRIEAQVEGGGATNPGVGSFFSGGVDGSYTMLKHSEEITHLVFVKGVDMQLDSDVLFQESLERNEQMAKQYGKTLVPVETNVRWFGALFKKREGVFWPIYHGAALASVALALGFRKFFIASSHTYAELFPWGSNPLTDRLWSSDRTEIVHDGAEASRSEKLRRIAQDEHLLQQLRVCWQDSGYNCGRCEKCLRTMIALRVLGVSTPTLPHLDSAGSIARLRIGDLSELTFFEDNLRLARAAGDRELARILSRCLLRYYARRWLIDIDEMVFSGRLKRLWTSSVHHGLA